MAESVVRKLKEAGYEEHEKQQYMRYSRGRGDATYITHSLNIIRATANTEGQAIVRNIFGPPNGKASESQDDNYDSWFFNGYTGKSGTTV